MKHYLYKLDELCFETASKEFRLIDDDGMNVIVNWENSMGLVENLKKSGCTYSLMKQLAKFTVGVHRSNFSQLINMVEVTQTLIFTTGLLGQTMIGMTSFYVLP